MDNEVKEIFDNLRFRYNIMKVPGLAGMALEAAKVTGTDGGYLDHPAKMDELHFFDRMCAYDASYRPEDIAHSHGSLWTELDKDPTAFLTELEFQVKARGLPWIVSTFVTND